VKDADFPLYSLTPFTTLDYPDKTACIAWFAGCNIRCAYCYNVPIVTGAGQISRAEFIKFLSAHKNADFFASYAVILRDFIDLERAVLGVEAPPAPIGDSAAVASMKKEPFQSKMPTAKTKLRWEEFSPVISQEFDD